MIGYELSLVSFGLKEYVFYGPRTDFISANREGFVSSFGYIAISLIGIEFGKNIFKALFDENEEEKEAKSN